MMWHANFSAPKRQRIFESARQSHDRVVAKNVRHRAAPACAIHIPLRVKGPVRVRDPATSTMDDRTAKLVDFVPFLRLTTPPRARILRPGACEPSGLVVF